MEGTLALKAEREFAALCKTIEVSMKQAENMHAEIEVLYAENSMMACAHEAVRLDMARMRGEVSDMYTQLHRLYGYSEENQRLATAAAQASKDAEAAREALLRVQNKCADEIAAVTAQAQKDAEQARADAHNDRIRATEKIQELQQRMAAMDNTHQQHITRLKLEYEQKLARAQHNTAGSEDRHGVAGSAQMQEIFRKKLLHAKSASDREIGGLRARVAELEKKLAATTTARKQSLAPYARKNV